MKEFLIAIIGLNIGCAVGFLIGKIGFSKLQAELNKIIAKLNVRKKKQ